MTMSPKRYKGVEYFETPGKEKVIALKEHLLKEFDESTKKTENLTIGQRVMKNDGSKVGIITDLDTGTLTATVKWDDGKIEHVQTNVLTGKDVPEKPVEEKRFNPKEAVDKLKELKEKILRRIKEDVIVTGKDGKKNYIPGDSGQDQQITSNNPDAEIVKKS